MCSARGCLRFAQTGFPIRKSSDRRLYTASRGLSQCPTSFIGTWRQGIHRKLLVASPRDAENLILFGLQKDQLLSVGKVLLAYPGHFRRLHLFFWCFPAMCVLHVRPSNTHIGSQLI